MEKFAGFLEKKIVPPLTKFSENKYMSAVRAGMVATVPFTIIGSIFMIIAHFPVGGWNKIVAPYITILEIPVTATFGCLGIIVTFSIAYELGKQFKLEAVMCALVATMSFLLIQLHPKTGDFDMDGLGVQGLFTGIIIAFVSVKVQQILTEKNLVIKLPESVPPMVIQSFSSLVPLFVLIVGIWIIRFVLGIDINHIVLEIFKPVVFALNTLPGILVYIFVITMLWSVGINGDNTLDPIAAPVFLMYLTANVNAMAAGQPLPYITANGFSIAFVNVGGTGATIALAIILFNSKEIGFRKISRMAILPSFFQINEPIFFGIPIVLNPLLMIPYVLSALTLAASTYLLMFFNIIARPVVMVPWTTPPIIGPYLVTGGDWRAAVWSVISIFIAIIIYFPFAKIAERQRLKAEAAKTAHV